MGSRESEPAAYEEESSLRYKYIPTGVSYVFAAEFQKGSHRLHALRPLHLLITYSLTFHRASELCHCCSLFAVPVGRIGLSTALHELVTLTDQTNGRK